MNYVILDRFLAFGITLQYLTLILILSLTLMMSALIFFEFSFLHLPWKVVEEGEILCNDMSYLHTTRDP